MISTLGILAAKDIGQYVAIRNRTPGDDISAHELNLPKITIKTN